MGEDQMPIIGYVDSIGEWRDVYLLEYNVEEPRLG